MSDARSAYFIAQQPPPAMIVRWLGALRRAGPLQGGASKPSKGDGRAFRRSATRRRRGADDASAPIGAAVFAAAAPTARWSPATAAATTGSASSAWASSAAARRAPRPVRARASASGAPTTTRTMTTTARSRASRRTPKKPGTACNLRYEAYKSATTVAEFLEKGGTPADLTHDVGKGFVWYLDDGRRPRGNQLLPVLLKNVRVLQCGRFAPTGRCYYGSLAYRHTSVDPNAGLEGALRSEAREKAAGAAPGPPRTSGTMLLRHKGKKPSPRAPESQLTQHATRGAAKRAASEKPKPRKRAKAEAAFGNEQAPLLGLDVYQKDEADSGRARSAAPSASCERITTINA